MENNLDQNFGEWLDRDLQAPTNSWVRTDLDGKSSLYTSINFSGKGSWPQLLKNDNKWTLFAGRHGLENGIGSVDKSLYDEDVENSKLMKQYFGKSGYSANLEINVQNMEAIDSPEKLSAAVKEAFAKGHSVILSFCHSIAAFHNPSDHTQLEARGLNLRHFTNLQRAALE